MNATNHILSKEGILTTFSIAKRVTEKDIENIRGQIGKKNKKINKQELDNLLVKTIMEQTQKAFEEQKIPGLVILGDKIPVGERKMFVELTHFAAVIAKKINEKQIDKFHSCYIINAIVNMLGLSESDFDEFHRKFSKDGDGDETSSMDGV
jgi:hypothetical protein